MIRRAFTLLLTALVLLTGAAQAAHATGYRYWSFWDRDGDTWAYATQGPSLARPSDGDVQGFRFAVSEDSKDAAKPRGAAEFAVICARTPAQDGKKRVALVIDFGKAADAPSGETPPARRTACARVAPDATTAEALAAVAKPLRYDTNALLCAISGYPEKGCGEQVAEGEKPTAPEKTTAENRETSDEGPSLGLVAGIAVVAVLGAAAVWQARRRRT
ncbi:MULTISPECIES: SCO2322 family protein [unclassified Streptomyces]|uniref:SCO2322 family protein n=1 Tax=unclassified Streptomyces TaxID=2593676 RepID=UPI002365CD8C|nr:MULTISPECIES: SCO2322 family protein [unclassified Streptomyces]MDF3146272.1 SCO2322 family protein [Streptomyces sp. T21Q-yed]WDF37697.1 SCO2322 family protein [Streptomyces sp. T12]